VLNHEGAKVTKEGMKAICHNKEQKEQKEAVLFCVSCFVLFVLFCG